MFFYLYKCAHVKVYMCHTIQCRISQMRISNDNLILESSGIRPLIIEPLVLLSSNEASGLKIRPLALDDLRA